MNLADGLHLHAKISAVRDAWLEVEQLAEPIYDDKLYIDIAGARMNILGARDRLEQLITDPEPEPDHDEETVLA